MTPAAQGVYEGPRFTEWPTPQWLFDLLNQEFNFTIDVCALPDNAKCTTFYTPEQNGLAQVWRGVCFMNPPYGRGIGEWLAKAKASSEAGATVVCVVPVRTSTAWWGDYVCFASEVRFLTARIKFHDTNPAPFDSCVVVFRGKDHTS